MSLLGLCERARTRFWQAPGHIRHASAQRISIVSCNTNCFFGDPDTAVASTILTDTLGYLMTQDIVLLQELGSKNAHIHAQALLHTHTLWYSTHQQYRRGKGVAVALHKRLSNYYHSHTIHDDHQLIHLRLKHLLPSDALLHVICWYLPHSGSTQLHALDLMSRFTHLAAIVDEITATQPGSLVVIAGDLNAKVGTAMPYSPGLGQGQCSRACRSCSWQRTRRCGPACPS